MRIDPCQASRSTIGDKDVSVVGDNTGGFREAGQRCDMLAAIVIDHFDAVPSRVRDENAAAARIEGAMIEGAAFSSRDFDDAYGAQRHDDLVTPGRQPHKDRSENGRVPSMRKLLSTSKRSAELGRRAV